MDLIKPVFKGSNLNQVMEPSSSLLLKDPAGLQDGAELTFLSHQVPISKQQDSIMGMVGIHIDIIDRKRSEAALLLEKSRAAAEAVNKAKTEFLENMNHDIRTAVTGIAGLSELLTVETDIHKVHHFGRELAKSSYELLHFLTGILESFHVSSGEIPLLTKRFSLRETLEGLVKLHQPMAILKQLKLSLDIDKAIPNYFMGDSVRIHRVVLELLANALKFTPTGWVRIVARLAKKEQHMAIIKLFVQDTGIGIPQDKQSEIFIHFKRLSPSYKGIYKGAGLGLSIVKQFVKDLDGEIYVNGHLNKGTQFVCILPLRMCLLEKYPFDLS